MVASSSERCSRRAWCPRAAAGSASTCLVWLVIRQWRVRTRWSWRCPISTALWFGADRKATFLGQLEGDAENRAAACACFIHVPHVKVPRVVAVPGNELRAFVVRVAEMTQLVQIGVPQQPPARAVHVPELRHLADAGEAKGI